VAGKACNREILARPGLPIAVKPRSASEMHSAIAPAFRPHDTSGVRTMRRWSVEFPWTVGLPVMGQLKDHEDDENPYGQTESNKYAVTDKACA
jgi:hypothetical protein